MNFSKKSRYGLRALIDLSVYSKESHVALAAIAERNSISPQYLEQVFAALRKAGIIKSVKGPQGGYLLAKPATKISVAEILRALEGDYLIKSCATGRIISCNGDSDLGDACGRNSAHDQQFRTCRCIWKKDCSTAAGNDGLDGVCISTAFILRSRVCGFQ